VPRREPGDGSPALPLLATVLCALFGGLLASVLWWRLGWSGLGWSRGLVAVPACAVVGTAMAFWLLTSPRPALRTPLPRAPGPAVEQAHPAPVPAGRDPAPVVPERAWWTDPVGQVRPSPPHPGPAPREAGEQPPLVAQCPRCGEFHLDVARNGPAYAFRCHHPGCGHTWGWTPGTAWPAVVVRRNLTAVPTPNRK
jgi:hypothetical protein